jgi:hypothetical protein
MDPVGSRKANETDEYAPALYVLGWRTQDGAWVIRSPRNSGLLDRSEPRISSEEYAC